MDSMSISNDIVTIDKLTMGVPLETEGLNLFYKEIDLYLRSNTEFNKISSAQHAHLKGKFVGSMFHFVTSCFEKGCLHKEIANLAFLDIEDAFNNIKIAIDGT